MHNCFTRKAISGFPSHQRALQSSLGCCVIKLATGLYSVIGVCTHPRHAIFQRLVDDPAWIDAYQAGAAPGAPPSDAHRAQREAHRATLLGDAPVKDCAISHRSAAIVHGLPLLEAGMPPREFISTTRSSTRAGRRIRTRRYGSEETVEVAGHIVTSPERTIADLAADVSLHSAVMAADHLLSARTMPLPVYSEPLRAMLRASREERQRRLAAQRGLCAKQTARARMDLVLALARGLSESPAESLAVVVLHQLGLGTRFRQQVSFRDDQGMMIARVDFLLDGTVIVEVDGWTKYDTSDHRTARRALVKEKRREDALRRAGYGFVRLEWADLMNPDRTAKKLRQAGLAL